jgi:hypothetical protein
MRYALCLLIIMVAACSGDTDNSPLPTQANNDTTVEATTVEGTPDPTIEAFEEMVDEVLSPPAPNLSPTPLIPDEGELAIPLPGQLVASETEEPEAISGPFTYLSLEQTGGPSDVDLMIELYDDGRVLRNGEAIGTVSQEAVANIDQIIRDVNFFGMQGALIGPPGTGEEYRYRLYVERGDEIARTVQAQDGFMPTEVVRLLSSIRGAAENAVGG